MSAQLYASVPARRVVPVPRLRSLALRPLKASFVRGAQFVIDGGVDALLRLTTF